MYQLVKTYLHAGLICYFQKIKVVGQENIPIDGAVMFISNHPNALLDPLIIGITNKRTSNFLTRAGVFKNKYIIRFFSMMKMLPVFRIRDGWSNLSKNKAIFESCYELFQQKEAIVIFAEGSHDIKKRIRPLSKGFTRILFGSLAKYPTLPLTIIPVGINYTNSQNFPTQVSIHYGSPLEVANFYSKTDIKKSVDTIKQEVGMSLKKLTVHIDDLENYELIKNNLDALRVNYLNPTETNRKIKQLLEQPLIKKNIPQTRNWLTPLYWIIILNSLIPWLLWKKATKNIQEIEFKSTFRFAFCITLFPFFYLLQSLLVMAILETPWHWYYLLFCFLSGLFYVKTAPHRL